MGFIVLNYDANVGFIFKMQSFFTLIFDKDSLIL